MIQADALIFITQLERVSFSRPEPGVIRGPTPTVTTFPLQPYQTRVFLSLGLSVNAWHSGIAHPLKIFCHVS